MFLGVGPPNLTLSLSWAASRVINPKPGDPDDMSGLSEAAKFDGVGLSVNSAGEGLRVLLLVAGSYICALGASVDVLSSRG